MLIWHMIHSIPLVPSSLFGFNLAKNQASEILNWLEFSDANAATQS